MSVFRSERLYAAPTKALWSCNSHAEQGRKGYGSPSAVSGALPILVQCPADESPGERHMRVGSGRTVTPRLPLESAPAWGLHTSRLGRASAKRLSRARVGAERLSARVAVRGMRSERRRLREGHGSCKCPATGRLAGPCTPRELPGVVLAGWPPIGCNGSAPPAPRPLPDS